MKKVLITIENNNLTFSYKKSDNKISTDLLNTNIISDNELVFSDDYIRENIKNKAEPNKYRNTTQNQFITD